MISSYRDFLMTSFKSPTFSCTFALGLFCQSFGLLLVASYSLADLFLNFAADVFGLAFDLVLVHLDSLRRC